MIETIAKGCNLTIPVNNFNLSYDDLGDSSIPIIFLHGYPFSKDMWLGQLEFLKSSRRVIACDIRGFGGSKDESSPLNIDLFGNDLLEFMTKLGIDKAVICGLSMGGFIALNVVKRFPDRFVGLILCDTQCIADTVEVRKKRYQTIAEIEAEGVDLFNEGFIKSVFHPDSITNQVNVVETLRKVVFANSKHIITQGLVALADRLETCSTLGAIAIPTLIICGRADEVTPLAQSEYMNQQIKGSTLQVIDKAGHVSNLEQPEEFNKYLGDFLTTLNVMHAVG